MNRSTPSPIAAFLVAALAAATVGGALVFQYGYGYVPCMLCLWERWPYYLGAPLAALAGVLALSGRPREARLVMSATALLFLGGAVLGVYHAGVEWGFWDGPASCAGANAAPTSAADMLRQMGSTKVVPCDRAAWRFLGFSLAGYNALIAAVLGLLSVWVAGAGKAYGSSSLSQ